MAPWCTSHHAKLQGVFYTVHLLLPTQADKSNTVIDTLRAVVMPDIQGHAVFPAVNQKANDGMVSLCRNRENGVVTNRLVTLRTTCSANPRRLHLGVVYTLVIAETFWVLRVTAQIEVTSPSDS